MNTNRRTFLKTSALAAAALSAPGVAWSASSAGRVLGANDEIRVGIVGFKGRGGDHIGGTRKRQKDGDKVRIVALCDVDSEVLAKGVADFDKQGASVQGFKDIREMLEKAKLDAVTIATPNHWHALAAIWSVQAGADVYLEKPVSHNVWEGRQIVEAARKYGRIVQTGTQSRSSHAIKEAIQWVRAGNLGKIKVARGLCYKPRNSIGKVTEPTPIPANIDYNLWCGPAPMGPLMRKNLHYDWHWVWATGNGDLGNQGIHQMDIARWFLGEMELSPRVFSVGGRLGYVDDGETPNTQFVYHDYPGAPLIFEVRGLPEKKGARNMDKYRGGSVAVIIECEDGHVLVPNYTSATAVDKQGNEIKSWKGAADHYANFYAAMRTRKHTDLNADILEGHLSSALCHTGNVSVRLGQQLKPEEIRDRLKGNASANETFERMAAHLAANEVDLAATPLHYGEYLEMNPKKERFTNSAKANEMLTREYRKPFVVPERV